MHSIILKVSTKIIGFIFLIARFKVGRIGYKYILDFFLNSRMKLNKNAHMKILDRSVYGLWYSGDSWGLLSPCFSFLSTSWFFYSLHQTPFSMAKHLYLLIVRSSSLSEIYFPFKYFKFSTRFSFPVTIWHPCTLYTVKNLQVG